MATTSDSPMKFIESANCAICGRQIWAGVAVRVEVWGEEICKILHVEHLGGTLEQDETGALRSSKIHQYQVHICKAVEKQNAALIRRIERLTKALGFYAQPGCLTTYVPCPGEFIEDDGKIAREVLKEEPDSVD